MSVLRNLKTQYNQAYYHTKAILSSHKYMSMKVAYLAKLAEFGIDIPFGGILNARTRLAMVRTMLRNNINFDSFSDEVTKSFNVKKYKNEIAGAIKYDLLYPQDATRVSLENELTLKIPESKEFMQVSFKVFPWTSKEDVIDGLWERLLYHMNVAGWKNGNKRNREKSTFLRDFEVYELYVLKSKNHKGTSSVYMDIAASSEFMEIKEKYKASDSYEDSLGFVISNMKELLKDLEFV